MQHKLSKPVSKRKSIDDTDVKKQTYKGLKPKEAESGMCYSKEIIFITIKFTKKDTHTTQ